VSDLLNKVASFVSGRGFAGDITVLKADASTREYFRVPWNDSTAIICAYPGDLKDQIDPYIDTTSLFSAAHLPVAAVYDIDRDHGLVVQEDLGDEILREAMAAADGETREWLLKEAISLIARIQLATPLAVERNSIASQLRFDDEKLLWELEYFKEHYFTTLEKRPLSPASSAAMTEDFLELVHELAEDADVLCHRDFHAANLMIDRDGKMRMIDHQDARIGTVAYDLVSLLLDRITELPSPEWLADRRRYFLEIRHTLGLPKIEETDFAYQFRMQTVQRCLKAAGTFSYQSAARGKDYFLPFIMPMFEITLRGMSNLGRFPAIGEILAAEVARRDQTRR
jgi:N-acetylmuramate 1-kinase